MGTRLGRLIVLASLASGCGSEVDVIGEPPVPPPDAHVWSFSWKSGVRMNLSHIHVRPDGRIVVSGSEDWGKAGSARAFAEELTEDGQFREVGYETPVGSCGRWSPDTPSTLRSDGRVGWASAYDGEVEVGGGQLVVGDACDAATSYPRGVAGELDELLAPMTSEQFAATGTSRNAYPTAIAPAPDGGWWLGLVFANTLQLGSESVHTRANLGENAGEEDSVVVRLDADWEVLEWRQLGSNRAVMVRDLYALPDGGVLVLARDTTAESLGYDITALNAEAELAWSWPTGSFTVAASVHEDRIVAFIPEWTSSDVMTDVLVRRELDFNGALVRSTTIASGVEARLGPENAIRAAADVTGEIVTIAGAPSTTLAGGATHDCVQDEGCVLAIRTDDTGLVRWARSLRAIVEDPWSTCSNPFDSCGLVTAVALDPRDGAVILGGALEGTFDFGGGPTGGESPYEAYLLKLAP